MSDTPLPSLEKVKKRREQTVDAYAATVAYDNNLADEALRGSELHFRFMGIYNLARKAERRTRREVKTLRRTLMDYYRGFLNSKQQALANLGRGPCEMALSKDEINFYVESDPIMLDLLDLHHECEEWVSDCEMILEQINKRGYAIKTALTYLQYRTQMT